MQRILRLQDITEHDDGVDTLCACIPTEEEFNSVRAQLKREPDVSKYGKPEQFCIRCLDIVDYGKRMRAWQFLKEFDGKLQSKKPAFQLTLKFFDMMQQN